MRILHIVAGLPPGGGISESVPALCRYLRRAGHEVTLATLDGPMSEAALLAAQDGVRLVCFTPSWPRALFYSVAMLRGLWPLAAESDVVHVHSSWTFPVWWACRCTRKAGKPLVMSPRGCLDPVRLRHSAWKKRLVGWLDRYFLRRASAIHATCQAEAEGVEKYLVGNRQSAVGHEGGEVKRRIVVIPNGVEVGSALVHYFDSVLVEDRRSEIGGQRAEDNGTLEPVSITNERMNSRTNELPRLAVRTRSVLYLGRLHPLKGLDLLIDAWAEVKRSALVRYCDSAVRGSLVHYCDGALVGKPEVGDRRSAVGGEPVSQAESRLNLVEPDQKPIEPDSQTNELMNSRTNALPRWQLVIAGPDEQGTLARLIAQAESQGMAVSSQTLTVNSESLTVSGNSLAIKEERLTVYGLPFTTNADIVFIGPVYGEEKARLMAAADLFVLPTRSENFGIVVAEALASGVPVITTKGAPWQELLGSGESAISRESELGRGDGDAGESAISRESAIRQGDTGISTPKELNMPNALNQLNSLTPAIGRCGWWVDIGVEPLAEALREAMSLTDEERRSMGENGRRLVEAKYRWESVAQEMEKVYKNCVNAKMR